MVAGLSAGIYHRVQLRYHNSAFSNRPKAPSCEFVDKVTEGVVVFLFLVHVLNRKLQLALNFPHEEIVYHDVVGRFIQLVLDSHQLELPDHIFAFIKNVHSSQQADESALAALVLGSHQVADFEADQVHIFFCADTIFERRDLTPRLQQVMNKNVCVFQHERSQNRANFG